MALVPEYIWRLLRLPQILLRPLRSITDSGSPMSLILELNGTKHFLRALCVLVCFIVDCECQGRDPLQ
jgi:hypothetical protein